MALRLIQAPWTQQPQEAATPASGAPFPTPFLLFNAAQQRELISGRVPSVQNTVLTPAGYAYNTAGGVTGWTASDMGQPAGVDELCMVTWGRNTTPFNVNSETRLAAFGYGLTGLTIWSYNAGALRADVYHFPDYNGNISANGPILSANAPHAIGMRYIRNSALQLWVDGAVAATVAAPNKAAGLRSASNGRFDLSVGTEERAFQQAGAAVWLQDIGEAGMAALTRHPDAPWQLFEPRRIWVPVAAGGGGTTVALSGISATFAQTAPAVSSATSLVGESVTANAGILLPAFSRSLSGQAGTAFAGTLNTSTSRGLSGQSAAFAAGSVIPSVAIAAIGLQATFASGTLTASSSSGTTVNLVGEPVAFAQTAPSISVTVALTGIAATMAAGILSSSSGTATITVKAGSWLRYKKLQ